MVVAHQKASFLQHDLAEIVEEKSQSTKVNGQDSSLEMDYDSAHKDSKEYKINKSKSDIFTVSSVQKDHQLPKNFSIKLLKNL